MESIEKRKRDLRSLEGEPTDLKLSISDLYRDGRPEQERLTEIEELQEVCSA